MLTVGFFPHLLLAALLLCTCGRLTLASCITEILQSKEVASRSWQREGEGKDNPVF